MVNRASQPRSALVCSRLSAPTSTSIQLIRLMLAASAFPGTSAAGAMPFRKTHRAHGVRSGFQRYPERMHRTRSDPAISLGRPADDRQRAWRSFANPRPPLRTCRSSWP
jgi:hypothetical protein